MRNPRKKIQQIAQEELMKADGNVEAAASAMCDRVVSSPSLSKELAGELIRNACKASIRSMLAGNQANARRARPLDTPVRPESPEPQTGTVTLIPPLELSPQVRTGEALIARGMRLYTLVYQGTPLYKMRRDQVAAARERAAGHREGLNKTIMMLDWVIERTDSERPVGECVDPKEFEVFCNQNVWNGELPLLG